MDMKENWGACGLAPGTSEKQKDLLQTEMAEVNT